MRKIIAKIVASMAVVAMLLAPVVTSLGVAAPVYAADDDDLTSILPDNWDIGDILNFLLNLVMYGLGAAAVLGVVISGIMYMTARDNAQQAQRAKTRLFEVLIGLVAWAFMFVLLNWLIPSGISAP